MKLIEVFRRVLGRKVLVLGGFFPVFESEPVDFEKYKEARGLHIEDNWERVKIIFSKDDFGYWHPEMHNAIEMTEIGLFIGGMLGGSSSAMKHHEKFVHNNDASKFFGNREAYKILFNENMLSFCKGAFRVAPKFGIFLGSYSLFSSCLEAYRNKPGIIEYTIGGSAVGACFKFAYGIKGMISGGVVGSILGTFYGSLVYLITKLQNKDVLEIKYAQYAVSLQKKEYNERLMRHTDLEKLDLPDDKHHSTHTSRPLDFLEDIETSVKK